MCCHRGSAERLGRDQSLLLQECARHVGRLFLVGAVDLVVQASHHLVGQQRRKLVQGISDLRVLLERVETNDRRDVVDRKELLLVVANVFESLNGAGASQVSLNCCS
jgi:hypothetical protein